jgi:hypothetical protein
MMMAFESKAVAALPMSAFGRQRTHCIGSFRPEADARSAWLISNTL